MDLEPYLVPLVICKAEISYTKNAIRYDLDRYAGVAFYVDDKSRIVTCGHIVDTLAQGEALLGMDLRDNSFSPILDVRRHRKFDFATGILPRAGYGRFEISKEPLLPARDVEAYGFINQGKRGDNLRVLHRMFKGHVVSMSEIPATPVARSSIEISFPSHKGFSGTPLLCSQTRTVVGMLYSNSESSIETYRYEERKDDGKESAESIYRIVELGLAHSNADIATFLNDLQ